MIDLDTAQVWTVIGVVTAFVFGTFTMISTLFLRVLRTEIGGLRIEMSARFARLEDKVDRLDSDVNALMKHTFGIDRD